MRPDCRIILLAFALCGAARAAAAQGAPGAEGLPRGRVIERVVTRADASQSYALYLPSSYNPSRAWPVLYCFDPAGRGRVPVERFREAAERYGWIVAGSNNSRNGPVGPSVAAARAVWADTQERFALDGRRLYAAGFSGGARQAVRVNHMCRNCLAGVVAVGAGFPPELEPGRDARFAFYGLAGVEDFNFAELRRLDERLARLGFPHRLRVFDGAHQWAPAEECARAVGWMELRAMSEGRRARDDRLVDELYGALRAEAERYKSGGRLYDAYLARLALAEDFAGLRDAGAGVAEAARLAATKEVRRALSEEREQVDRQQVLFERVRALREAVGGAEDPPRALAEFRRAVAALREDARGKQDTGARRVARRAERQLFAFYYEAAANLRDRGAAGGRVAELLETAAQFAPDSPRLQFELACAYASGGEKKRALEALGRAAELGFDDADALAASEDLAPLRADKVFGEILTRLRQKP